MVCYNYTFLETSQSIPRHSAQRSSLTDRERREYQLVGQFEHYWARLLTDLAKLTQTHSYT